MACSLAWNLLQLRDEVRALTTEAARALLAKDLLYREWSLLDGGVYVPDTAPTEPDPYPKEERHILTPSGRTLTLLNPAVVSRQIFELQNQRLGIRGHLTSLRPIQPANAPDDWERQALQQFEKGSEEASTVENRQGERYFRMMHPLVLNPTCLRCHEEAGQKVGEIRGGLSVTVPMNRFGTPGEEARLAVAHVSFWLLGTAGLAFSASSLRRHLKARRQAEAQSERLVAELQTALANVKTLRGLVPICSSCKKIRNDQGYWTQLETYLREHSDAEFSHGLCTDCLRKLYPQFSQAVEARLSAQPPAGDSPPSGKPPDGTSGQRTPGSPA